MSPLLLKTFVQAGMARAEPTNLMVTQRRAAMRDMETAGQSGAMDSHSPPDMETMTSSPRRHTPLLFASHDQQRGQTHS